MSQKNANRILSVRRVGVEQRFLDDIYHRLLTMSWGRFLLLFVVVFLAINLIFATLYFLVPGSVANIEGNDFISHFFFSVQTFTTVGYGYFYPNSFYAHSLVTLETASGLLVTAILTGLIFSKFTRPVSQVLFSNNILLTQFNGKPMLALRMGNFRTNQVFEGRARLTLLRDEVSQEGEKLRRMVDMKLVRDSTPLFALSWLIYHPLDQDSPLFGLTDKDLHGNWQINVTFTGMDQDIGQTIVAQSFYMAEHVVPARKFKDMISGQAGSRVIDFSMLHEFEN